MKVQSSEATGVDASHRYLPLLLLLFIGSGCAALIYEVVWLQLLQLVIGVSPVSLGVLLGTFMGGMCVGSLLLPRYIGRDRHPLKVYAWLELGIAAFGLLILVAMPAIAGVYTAFAGTGAWGLVVRCLVASLCLLPPTLLMGATLPAISRWVETSPRGVGWLGFFYGGNIAGAVIGSLVAGFYLLRVYNVQVATFAAFGVNVLVALLALAIASRTPGAVAPPAGAVLKRAQGSSLIYVSIALSGVTALSAEVIWTRILSLVFGATVYTFSLILAAFLLGLGIGSSVGSVMARDFSRPRLALGWCQMLLCAAMAWAAYMLTQSLPYWPINPSISTGLSDWQWFNFQLDMVRCLWVVLPGAILWGASFPLALASIAERGEDPARLVGGVYAANTVGAILGSLLASLALVAWIGTQHAQQVLIVISAISGLIVLAPVVAGAEQPQGKFQLVGTLLLVAATGGAGLLAKNVHPVPGLLIAYGRYSATWINQSSIIYTGEGLNASVAVTELASGVRNYHNAGKVQASSEPQDMRLQRMLGHFTTLIPKSPKSVLVIGFGAGVTAGAVSISPAVEHETIAEIEPLVPKVVSTYFSDQNYSVFTNKKVTVHYDDARHFVLTTKEKFDAITSDPLDPWVKGAAALYTREFFEMAKSHLNPGGVVTLFVQLYESNEAAVKSEVGTFFEAFPHGVVFGNTQNGQGYDLVLVGQVEPTKINVDELDAKLKSPDWAPVAQSLREVGFSNAIDLLSTYAGQAQDMGGWLKDASINHDNNLRLQYLAGLGFNLYQAGPIYSNMLVYSKFPDNLFTGSESSLAELRAGIQRAQGR
jgi:spermidine synthase